MARDTFQAVAGLRGQVREVATELLDQVSTDPLDPARGAAEQFLQQQDAAVGAGVEAAQGAAQGVGGALQGALQAESLQQGVDSARAVADQLSTPPRSRQEAEVRARGLRSAWSSIRDNPNVPQAVKDQVEQTLTASEEALASMQELAEDFTGSIVGQDEQVDAVTGRPVPGYVRDIVRDGQTTVGTPESIARDLVTAPGGAPGAAETPAGTPTPGGAPAGAGGARRGSRTASLAAQLQAALQGGGEGTDEILARLVESYRQEGFKREEFGQDAAGLVTAEAEQQRQFAEQARAAFEADLRDQERRLAEVDAQIGALTSTPFNANRLFHDQGLNVAMALGVAVNAATAVMQNALFPGSNATNTALALVQGAIERDVQTQMVNFERGVQRLTSTRTAYDMARQLSGDRQAAYEFAMSQSQRHAGEQLRARAMQVQGVAARENLMRQADDLLYRAAQGDALARMQMAEALYERAGRGGPGGRTDGQGGRIFAPFAVRTERAAGLSRSEIEKALGQTTANRLTEGLEGIADSVDILDEISQLVQGYSSLSLVDRAQMGALIANFQDSYRRASGMGALDAGALDVLKRVLSNPNDMTTTIPEFLAQLRTQRGRLVRSARRRVNTLGDGLIQWDPRPDPSGATDTGGLGEGVTPVNETRPQTPTLGATLSNSTVSEIAGAVVDVIPEELTGVVPGLANVQRLRRTTGGN